MGWRLRALDSSVRKARVSVQAHRTEGVTGSEGRQGANGVGGGIGVGGRNGDGNGVGGGNGYEAGVGAGTGRERGRGRGWRPVDEHRMGTGTGTGTETRTVADMGTRIGSGRAEERPRSANNRTRV